MSAFSLAFKTPVSAATLKTIAARRAAERDFSVAPVKALAAKGVRIVSATLAPVSGSFANAEPAYQLDDNGCGKVRTFADVLRMAA